MQRTRVKHPIPLLVTALVAFLSAVAALAVSDGGADAHGTDSHHANQATTAITVSKTATATKKGLALHDGMRKPVSYTHLTLPTKRIV